MPMSFKRHPPFSLLELNKSMLVKTYENDLFHFFFFFSQATLIQDFQKMCAK